MKYFVFRNSTIEPFFNNNDASFSGYDDISEIPKNIDVFLWFYLLSFKSDVKILVDEISDYFSKLVLISKQIPSYRNIYVFTLYDINDFHLISGDYSLSNAIAEYNLNITYLSNQNSNIKIIDFSNFATQFPRSLLIDWKYYFLSKMQLNPKIASEFKLWFKNQINAIEFKRKKCIILDLDNTLWGGILGEDGINGIQIGDGYPGNAFLEFQKTLLELSKSGIILAVCSKNNETDVIDVWNKNPNIVIKSDQISLYRINWNNKADNIKEIVDELNIGFDSVVFIDDNPTERELVKQFFPAIETPEFPRQPYLLPMFIKELVDKYFMIYSLTDEDKIKTAQYKIYRERNSFQASFADFEIYLENLEMEICLQKVNEFTISRIAQMTQKTNQFNLTTKRYSESELVGLIEKGYLIYSLSVKDKFGDNGITGAMIIELNKQRKCAIIDSFLLSCRILGKGIDKAFIFLVLNKLKVEGYKMVHASFFPTLKNEQVKNYYEELNFELVRESMEISDAKNYSIDLTVNQFNIKPYFKIIEI